MESWGLERRVLWEVTREMVTHSLVSGSSGNASLRLPEDGGKGLVLITPGRRPYRDLRAEDLVVIDLKGETVEGDLLPSFETALHLGLYAAREDVGSVIHTHSVYASVAAVSGLEIPPIVDEMVVKVGGSVRVAEYAFPSTEELSQRACSAMGERNAVLLRNHGLVAVGRSPWDALEVCQLVERVAQVFVYSSLVAKANHLPPEIVSMEQELFRMQKLAQGSRWVHEGGSEHGDRT